MNVNIAKDEYSFYLINLLSAGDELTYDWSLSRSYSLILGRGKATINSETRTAPGIFNVAANTQITISAEEDSVLFSVFLLDDDTLMGELFPTGTTLSELRASTSFLIDLEESLSFESITPELSFSGLSSPGTFSLSDLNTKVLGAL
jgi:hypothetical protein